MRGTETEIKIEQSLQLGRITDVEGVILLLSHNVHLAIAMDSSRSNEKH